MSNEVSYAHRKIGTGDCHELYNYGSGYPVGPVPAVQQGRGGQVKRQKHHVHVPFTTYPDVGHCFNLSSRVAAGTQQNSFVAIMYTS